MVIISTIDKISKNINIDVDDKDFLNKIAIVYETLPRFINYNDGNVDILGEYISRDVKENNIDFISFYDSIRNIFSNTTELEILKLWIINNTTISSDKNLLFYTELQVEGLLDIKSFLNYEKDDFIYEISKQYNTLKKQLEKQAEIKKKLEGSIPYTKFFPKYKNYRIISTHEIPLSVIFDNIIPTSEIPFISYSNMYKYMIDFIPDSTMNISMNNTILLKRKSDTDFLDILLFIENSKIIIEYSVSTTESYENVF